MNAPVARTEDLTRIQDTVARRIVMPRQTWDRLVQMSDILHTTQGLEVSATDVALIALEAGLQAIEAGRKAAAQAPGGSGRRARSGGKKASASGKRAGSRSGKRSGSGRAASSSAFARRGASGSTGRTRRAVSGLTLGADDLGSLAAVLESKNSVRARQRALALWLGHERGRVELEWLRELTVTYDAYDVANFAQNMKKDGALFEELRDEAGARQGWKLTDAGQAAAAELFAQALATAGA